MMNPTSNFDAFFKTFTQTMPQGLLSLHQDMEKNLRAAFEATLRKMNLVTREEFEVQKAVLERTRARLETLESRVATLEALYLPKQELSLTHSDTNSQSQSTSPTSEE
jgi:BMFP domain-containing protein YqiC